MSNGFCEKIILIMIYLIIIILIALFLDYLFKITVRKKRKLNIKHLAEKAANDKKKPLIIFNDRYHGVVIDFSENPPKKEPFSGDIDKIVDELADNSCVLIVSQTIEYIDNPAKLIKKLKIKSGGDLYLIDIEKNSPRVLWDYKIKNIMEKSFYLPSDKEVVWSPPNKLQTQIQKFYSYVFKILPYNFFVNDPVEKV